MSIGAVAQRFQWKWQYDHDDDKHGTDRDKPAVEIVDNYATNANCAIWWSNLELMQVAPPVGQIWNQFWWHHLVVKFWTNTSGTTYNWPNLEPMQVALYLAGEITQVKESIPWVRCASGNVLDLCQYLGKENSCRKSAGGKITGICEGRERQNQAGPKSTKAATMKPRLLW